MATQYLSFPDQKTASDQAASDWVALLGRAKRPQDGTTYLWGVLVNPKDATALGVIPDAAFASVPNKQTKTFVPASDPTVSATLAEVAKATPVMATQAIATPASGK